MSREYQDFPPREVAEVIWERGEIDPWQLLRIAVWKSAQGNVTGYLALNDPEYIRQVTREVVSVLRPWRSAESPPVAHQDFWDATDKAIGYGKERALEGGLKSLKGVNLPVASAVLCVMNSAAWPVIDRFAWSAVFVETHLERKLQRRDMYRAFEEGQTRMREPYPQNPQDRSLERSHESREGPVREASAARGGWW